MYLMGILFGSDDGDKILKSSKCRPTQLNSDDKSNISSTSIGKNLISPSSINGTVGNSKKKNPFKRRFSTKSLRSPFSSHSTATTPDRCTSTGFSSYFRNDNNENLKARSAVTSPMSAGYENSSNSNQQIVGGGGGGNVNSGSLSPTIAKLLNCIPLKKFSSSHNSITVDSSSPSSTSTTPRTTTATATTNVVVIQNYANEPQNNVRSPSTTSTTTGDIFDFRRSGVYLGNETGTDSTLEFLKQKKLHQLKQMEKHKAVPSTSKYGVEQIPCSNTAISPREMNVGGTKLQSTKDSDLVKCVENGDEDDDDEVELSAKSSKKGSRPVFTFGSPPLSCRSQPDDGSSVSTPEETEKDLRKFVEAVQASSASSRYSTPPSSMSPLNHATMSAGSSTTRLATRSPTTRSPATSRNGVVRATEEQMRKLLRRSQSLASADMHLPISKENTDISDGSVISASSPARKTSQPSLVNPGAKTTDDIVPPLSDPSKKNVALKKKRSFAQPIAKKLSFLRRRPTDTSLVTHNDNNTKVGENEVKNWALSFENLLRSKRGVAMFRLFLQREFSDENIEFWLACEDYKKITVVDKLILRSKQIYADFVAFQAPKEVNLDSVTRGFTIDALAKPDVNTFDQAQYRIQSLMAKDSYPRFLRSDVYLDLLK